MAALFIPVLVLMTGIISAIGWQPAAQAMSHTGIHDWVGPWWTKIILGGVISLVFVHALHRIRHFVIDLHAPVHHGLLAVLSYGLALAGIVTTILVLVLF